MDFKKFYSSDPLKPYIRYYFVFSSESYVQFEDTVFPSGDMEIIFNLGDGVWETAVDNKFLKTPKIEFWGQITQPLQIRSTGKHTMLGIKFFTHAPGYFLGDEIGLFNNQVFDASDLIGPPVKALHAQLLETKENSARIGLIEKFLLKRLSVNERKSYQMDRVASILSTISGSLEENNVNSIASTHNMTSRNLQKLIYRHTGLSPKLVNKINRFQHSLTLIGKKELSLTGIAYDCGYFDQSHFIREFKSFTGVTPSAYLVKTSPVNQAFLQ